jgi:hypothetical protein
VTFATLHTTLGPIRVELFDNHAPKTVRNFIGLAEGTTEYTHPVTNQPGSGPYYDGVLFHRVIEGFMAQTGDPTGTGTGGPGLHVPGRDPPGPAVRPARTCSAWRTPAARSPTARSSSSPSRRRRGSTASTRSSGPSVDERLQAGRRRDRQREDRALATGRSRTSRSQRVDDRALIDPPDLALAPWPR